MNLWLWMNGKTIGYTMSSLYRLHYKFPTTIFNGVRPPWQIPSHIMTSPPPNRSVSEKQPPVKWSPVPLYTHVCDVSVGDEPYSPVLDHSELITFGFIARVRGRTSILKCKGSDIFTMFYRSLTWSFLCYMKKSSTISWFKHILLINNI